MYSFRTASAADKEDLYSIMSKNMAEYFQRFTSEGWSKEKFDEGFKPERITVCEKDGKIVAFYDVDTLDSETLYVRNLQVVRGSKPVGRALIQRIEEEALARGLKRLKGKIFKSNPAIRIFNAIGCKLTEEIANEGSYWIEKSISKV